MTQIVIQRLKCLRCDHEWIIRKEGFPKYCPKCKSPYWNKVRKRNKPIVQNEGPEIKDPKILSLMEKYNLLKTKSHSACCGSEVTRYGNRWWCDNCQRPCDLAE